MEQQIFHIRYLCGKVALHEKQGERFWNKFQDVTILQRKTVHRNVNTDRVITRHKN